jgi:hypothetical protein
MARSPSPDSENTRHSRQRILPEIDGGTNSAPQRLQHRGIGRAILHHPSDADPGLVTTVSGQRAGRRARARSARRAGGSRR